MVRVSLQQYSTFCLALEYYMIDSVFEGLCHRVWKFLQYEAMKVMSESSLHDNFRQSTNYQALVNFLIPKVLPSCIFSLPSFLTSIVTILR